MCKLLMQLIRKIGCNNWIVVTTISTVFQFGKVVDNPITRVLLTYFSSVDDLGVLSHGDAWTQAGKETFTRTDKLHQTLH